MGALVYEPEIRQEQPKPTVLDMRKLVEEARLALNADLSKMEGPDTLREIIRVGTSAGGAQAKAVVGWNRETDSFLAGDCDLPPDYEHWLIKFTPPGLPSAGEEEYAVYQKARAAGVEMSECRLYELDGVAHFMTRRFDRDGAKRHHVQTFRAMRALPPDVSLEMNSYGQLFETIVALGLGYDALSQMFRRMAFNVYSDETDDHSKNFSFILKDGGSWHLAPAYDLTGGVPPEAPEDDTRRDWTNCHAMSINGKQSNITDEYILEVVARHAIVRRS
jgi:serine/threonine-protein kinase HipA